MWAISIPMTGPGVQALDTIGKYWVSLVYVESPPPIKSTLLRRGNWNPDTNENDRNHRDTLAARGYWQAFQAVEDSIKKIVDGSNAVQTTSRDHGTWARSTALT